MEYVTSLAGGDARWPDVSRENALACVPLLGVMERVVAAMAGKG
jgi:hypothetical protein